MTRILDIKVKFDDETGNAAKITAEIDGLPIGIAKSARNHLNHGIRFEVDDNGNLVLTRA